MVRLNMKLLFKLLAGLCVVLMLASCGSSTPEAAAKKYMEAVFDGDADKVISMIYLPDKEKKEPGVQDMLSGKVKGMVADAKKRADKNSGVKEITTDEAKYSEDKKTAEVMVTVTFKNNDSEPKKEHVSLIDIDGGWKLNLGGRH